MLLLFVVVVVVVVVVLVVVVAVGVAVAVLCFPRGEQTGSSPNLKNMSHFGWYMQEYGPVQGRPNHNQLLV